MENIESTTSNRFAEALKDSWVRFKIIFTVIFIFFFVVYLVMPFFSTSWDFEGVLPEQVSLGGYVWRLNDYRHIANYISQNHRTTFAVTGLNRDVFMLGVGIPVAGVALMLLLLTLKEDRWLKVTIALLALWGIAGGLLYMSDPLLNLGGVAWVLMFVALYVMAGLAVYQLIRLMKRKKFNVG